MKLRFRENSLRLRLNRREVASLAAGEPLEERLWFPNSPDAFTYRLSVSAAQESASASFADGAIQVFLSADLASGWAANDDLGLYFDLPTARQPLKIAIEKDLICIDGPPAEADPDAFPRAVASAC